MRKIVLCLTIIVVIQSNVFAQFTNVWTKLVNATGPTDYPWFNNINNANNVMSLAYNPATDKLLVSNRNSNVYIINATTGAQEGTLSLVGLGGESYKFNKIRVDANGVIYGISLVLGPTNACKIYRWASQTANPVECASFTVTERTGDSFGLSGTGANTVLYASGAATTSNAFNIYILNTTDGLNFNLESKVTMTSSPVTGQQWANRVVEPVGVGVNSDIWINGGGFNARRISISEPTGGVRTGTVVTTIADGLNPGQASIGYGGMRYITGSANKFLVFAGGNNPEAGTVMRALNVTNEAAITTHGTEAMIPTTSYVTNSNGTGDVSFKVNGDGSFVIFYLSTNNVIAATLSGANVLPVALTSFTATASKDFNQLNWTTASESNNRGFEVQRSVDGQEFTNLAFVSSKAVQGNSSVSLSYNFEDKIAPAGTLYYRLKQVDLNGNFEYSDIKSVRNNLTEISAKLYPNPVQNDLIISIPLEFKGLSYSIHNMVGQEFMKGKAEELTRINVAALVPGIYFVKIVSAQNETQSLKFIKQ